MRYILFSAFLVTILWSCSSPKKADSGAVAKNDTSFLPPDYGYKKLEGTYSGDFGGSDIHLYLRHVTGRRAMGYSMLKGLKRNFFGSMKQEANTFIFRLSEPGNNEYDGIFEFALDTANMSITGNWTPNNTQKAAAKHFVLTRHSDTIRAYLPPFGDSIGVLSFEESGTCNYENYQDDKNQTMPAVTVTGNWSRKGNLFVIDWQANSVFDNRRQELKIERELRKAPDDSVSYIMFNGRKLIANQVEY